MNNRTAVTDLYISPVGDDWIDRFNETVTTPTILPPEAPDNLTQSETETRIWGTTDGKQKRTHFYSMASGDPILFYRDGVFFAAGRVGTTFENQEVGEYLWGNSESRLLYTIESYQELSVPSEQVGELLGYESGWFPRGFTRVSENAVGNLLQQYSSVEEAFQDLQSSPDELGSGAGQGDRENKDVEGSSDGPREHTEIQWRLIKIGLAHNYDVYVAKNDKNREYEEETLGQNCLDSLVLPGFSQAVSNIIEYVDVIWLDGNQIVKMFEIESTTSIYSGILRMTDFMIKVPSVAVKMYIVAPGTDEDKVRSEMNRPTFQHILDEVRYSTLHYLSFDDVRNTHETIQQAGPLQQVF